MANKHWIKINDNRYQRSDGAVVKYDIDTPYSNPVNPSARMWTAWEPDPSSSYIKQTRKNSRLNWPKRWKNPVKAMQEINKLFP